ncbi:hypothetical protein EBESD8_20940 [Rhodococcus aetherivorans]|nr:hypothetical protein EBESD8_20940 [Rhodococcus aetherivorans]
MAFRRRTEMNDTFARSPATETPNGAHPEGWTPFDVSEN